MSAPEGERIAALETKMDLLLPAVKEIGHNVQEIQATLAKQAGERRLLGKATHVLVALATGIAGVIGGYKWHG